MTDIKLYVCPWCEGGIEIEQVACGIFRHGIYKNTGAQIPPHAAKFECDIAVEQKLIEGCGKPFKYAGDILIKCDYI